MFLLPSTVLFTYRMIWFLPIAAYSRKRHSRIVLRIWTYRCILSLLQQDISINLLGDCHHNLAQQTFIKTKYQQVSGRVCRWKDYRIYIKGWDSFCRRNEIERDDTCFCEVISGEEQGVRTLRVHVARRRWTPLVLAVNIFRN